MYDIVIAPERLNHFPKTVPVNVREAVLDTPQSLNRIRACKAAQKAMASNEAEQKEEISEPTPASAPVQEDKVPAPARRRKPRTEIFIKKPGASGEINVKAESDNRSSAEATVQPLPSSIPKWK